MRSRASSAFAISGSLEYYCSIRGGRFNRSRVRGTQLQGWCSIRNTPGIVRYPRMPPKFLEVAHSPSPLRGQIQEWRMRWLEQDCTQPRAPKQNHTTHDVCHCRYALSLSTSVSSSTSDSTTYFGVFGPSFTRRRGCPRLLKHAFFVLVPI